METYWKENRTGCIYKYAYGTKPYNADTAWTQVAPHDYEEQMADALLKRLRK